MAFALPLEWTTQGGLGTGERREMEMGRSACGLQSSLQVLRIHQKKMQCEQQITIEKQRRNVQSLSTNYEVISRVLGQKTKKKHIRKRIFRFLFFFGVTSGGEEIDSNVRTRNLQENKNSEHTHQ